MALLDIFKTDAFDLVELTNAILELPYTPSRLGGLGLFREKPVSKLTVLIEKQADRLVLIPQAPRGTRPNVLGGNKRNVRAFSIPHLPLDSAVQADDVQGVRAFGSEDDTEGVQEVVNDRLETLRQSHEVTHEYHRAGAINGVLLDADGGTIYDYFTEFGFTQTVISFDGFADEDIVKTKAQLLKRTLRHTLGAQPFTRILALCGNNFFDELIKSAAAKDAWNQFQDNQFARTLQDGEGGFNWCEITWENYDGTFGDMNFIDPDECTFIPVGVPDLFQVYIGPANFVETVNTLGKLIYAKQEVMKFDMGVDIHTQSNPLHLCTRPQALIKGIITGSDSFPEESSE